MDKLTPEQRHKNMSHIKSKDTKIECILRHALWNRGYRYRKNYKGLPGKPDIVLTKYKIAIFCDSEFFHGKDFDTIKQQLKNTKNHDFWVEKISKNIEHDNEVEKQLRYLGWYVMRFWGKNITKDAEGCVDAIEEVIFERKIDENSD